MNESTIAAVCPDLDSALSGRRFGKIVPLSRTRFVIDFRLDDQAYLFISVDPVSPRIYLVKRRFRDVEKKAISPNPFVLYLKKRLSGAVVSSVRKLSDERVLMIGLTSENEIGENTDLSLVVQLTGRSSNLLLLDDKGTILATARDTRGVGQEEGTTYAPPGRPAGSRPDSGQIFPIKGFSSLSESLDAYYLEKESEQHFRSRADTARKRLNTELSKRRKLVSKLRDDLEGHGDAERWKRYGDLILANLTTAKRRGTAILVTDYFDESLPEVEVPADEGSELTELAEVYFRRYAKARNAAVEIADRLSAVENEIERFEREKERLEEAIESKDISFFPPEEKETAKERTGRKKQPSLKGVRRFVSSEGLEILVGKKASDNDNLTFRIARSLDLWLHAADYPGSHVVIRRLDRNEVPQNTLLEAAQLAAFYSSARDQGKAAVHYTHKKFVNKPKGAAPGLVSLASFKTIIVEAKFPVGVSGDAG